MGKKPASRKPSPKPAKAGAAGGPKAAGPKAGGPRVGGAKAGGSKAGAGKKTTVVGAAVVKPANKSLAQSPPKASGKAGGASATKTTAKSSARSVGKPAIKSDTKAVTAKPTDAKQPSPKSGGKSDVGSGAKSGAKAAGSSTAKADPKAGEKGGAKSRPTAKVAGQVAAKSGSARPGSVKPGSKNPEVAKPTVGKPGAGKPTAAKPGGPAAAKDAATAGVPAAGDAGTTVDANGKVVRKGITIVSNKPRRTGPKQVKILIPKNEPLLGPGSPFRKPLIASGPGAVRKSLEIDPESLAKLKSPFNKKELQRFRDILIKKRADLVGDVSDLESEALLGRSGSLSALPQHIAEQGSETYEQSLSLNLAAEDRRLIREIDGALQRIDKGTFGICEMTGKAITRERLEELPWTRYSIEAAREFERRSMGR